MAGAKLVPGRHRVADPRRLVARKLAQLTAARAGEAVAAPAGYGDVADSFRIMRYEWTSPPPAPWPSSVWPLAGSRCSAVARGPDAHQPVPDSRFVTLRPRPSPQPLYADLRVSLGLIGPQRRLPAPLAAGIAHGLERLRHIARAVVRKLSHRRLKHGPRDHEPHPAPTRLRLLRQNRERRPRSEVIDSGPAW